MSEKGEDMEVVYEPPTLEVLGTARELTQGPTPGPNPDALLFHTSP